MSGLRNDNFMNIVFAVNDNGFEMMAVALYSVIKNNLGHELKFYLFHKDISKTNLTRLKMFEKKFSNVTINVKLVEEKYLHNIEVTNKNVTIEAFFRYLAPEFLKGEPRALYVDYDMLCLEDISRLYILELEGNSLAAVADYVVENEVTPTFIGYKKGIGFKKADTYVNSGLLLMDIDSINNDDIMERFWDNVRNKHEIIPKKYNIFADQTVLNLTFKNKIKLLDARYNVFTTVLNELKQKKPAIIHFTGSHKPLMYRDSYVSPYDDIYYDYYRECMRIIGDTGDTLVKKTLKKLNDEIVDYKQAIAAKDNELVDIRDRLATYDNHSQFQQRLIDEQNKQLSSVLLLQKRFIKLMLAKFKN